VRVDRPGQIIVSGAEPIPCRILDVSATGAKLRPGWTGCLPNAFDVRDIFSGVERATRIVRWGINAIGVRYHEGIPDPKRHSGFGKR
jgi:hypothetical protein